MLSSLHAKLIQGYALIDREVYIGGAREGYLTYRVRPQLMVEMKAKQAL